MFRTASIEPLESRIAPALVVANPIADIIAGPGSASYTVELSQLFDAQVANPGHTLVTFKLNLDSDLTTPGIQHDFNPNMAGDQEAIIVIELFDNEAPLTVQNFLRYASNSDTAADFLNTFFHRSVPGFIIQGGGFDRKDIDTHIKTFSDVHNEFSVTRSNVRGTVAMAKTGQNPNTATSEWFVNLADSNAGNLDNQNGGFTVFGQVIQGMDIIDKIAALPRANFGGALTDTPVQNYNPDPDHNAATPPPAPTNANLISIIDVDITKPVPGNPTTVQGVTFTVTVKDATTNLPSDVLTPVLDGTKLNLNYAPGKSGVVNVTVHAERGSGASLEMVDEVFQVTVRPNLVAEVTKDPFQNIIVPGDGGKTKVVIKNSGAASFTGNLTVNYYLSKATGFSSNNVPQGTDPQGTLVNDPGVEDDLFADDILLHTTVLNSAFVPAGGSLTLDPVILDLPLKLTDGTSPYRLIAQIVPEAGTATELFTDDNVAVDGGLHALTSQFGKAIVGNLNNLGGFGTRNGIKLKYVEPDGDRVVFSIVGKGTGNVTLDGALVNIAISGTNVFSQVLRGGQDRASIHNLDVSNTVGMVNFGTVDSTGYLTFSGGLGTLTLGNAGGDHGFIIGMPVVPAGTAVPKAVITLGRVHDLSIESLQGIASITAVEWLDTTGQDDLISTPSLRTLKILGMKDNAGTVVARGDFEANVFVEKRALINSVIVRGLVNESSFITAGSIGMVKLGAIANSSFFAGVEERPDVRGDFLGQHNQSISTFTVRGLAGVTNAFVDSDVAAAKLGMVKVLGVDTATGADDFGFVADSIVSYSRVALPPVSIANLSAPAKRDVVGHYSLTIL